MEIGFPEGLLKDLEHASVAAHRSMENQVIFWVEQAINDLKMSNGVRGRRTGSKSLENCLVPNCLKYRIARGLCQKHYARVARWMKEGFLREGWLIRHGKLLGEDLDPVYKEDLNTVPLPTPIATRDADAKWFFDWPKSQQERDRLYKERDEAYARDLEIRKTKLYGGSPPPDAAALSESPPPTSTLFYPPSS